MSLEIFACPRPLARQAVMDWHYSRSLPAAGLDCYGIRECGRFVGVVIFGMGANPRLGMPFGLPRAQVRELVRVALAGGRSIPTSRVVAACLDRLRKARPELRLVVSYADPRQGHIGTLYQAGNWTYLGQTPPARVIRLFGERMHPRSLYQRHGTSSLAWLKAHVDPEATGSYDPPKHRYAYAFDGQIRRRLRRLGQPYPCGQGVTGDSPGDQPGGARSIRADRTKHRCRKRTYREKIRRNKDHGALAGRKAATP